MKLFVTGLASSWSHSSALPGEAAVLFNLRCLAGLQTSTRTQKHSQSEGMMHCNDVNNLSAFHFDLWILFWERQRKGSKFGDTVQDVRSRTVMWLGPICSKVGHFGMFIILNESY